MAVTKTLGIKPGAYPSAGAQRGQIPEEPSRYRTLPVRGSDAYTVEDERADHPNHRLVCRARDKTTAERIAHALRIKDNLGL